MKPTNQVRKGFLREEKTLFHEEKLNLFFLEKKTYQKLWESKKLRREIRREAVRKVFSKIFYYLKSREKLP